MITFIGDIHGDLKIVEDVLEKFKDREKVFVGDIFDSYNYDRLDQRMCMDLILADVQSGGSKLVLGNHELSYLYTNHRCPGRDDIMQTIVSADYRHDLFQYAKNFVYYKQHRLLVTHAGLTNQIWEMYQPEMGVNTEETLEYLNRDPTTILYRVGYARGGHAPYGGIFWCDWNKEFIPIPGLKQVMGHTPVSSIDWKGGLNNWNVDCLSYRREILTYDESTGKFIIEPF